MEDRGGKGEGDGTGGGRGAIDEKCVGEDVRVKGKGERERGREG